MRSKKKNSVKKNRRHSRPQKNKKRSEGLIERTLDRLTPA